MRPTWSTVVRRVAELLGRQRTAREEGEEEAAESGFTLIELMVVLLIMGILMAIAIPTFLGVTNGANDRSTQSNLTNAMTSAKAIYAQTGTYTTTQTKLATQLKKAEPELNFITDTAASTHQNTLSVNAPTGSTLYMAAYMTKTHVCWVARDTESGTGTHAGVEYGYLVKTTGAFTTSSANCKAGTLTTAKANWARKWPISPNGH